VDEDLLLRGSECHEDEPGPGGPDALQGLAGGGRPGGPEVDVRAVQAAHRRSEAPGELGGHLFRHPRTSPEEVDGPALAPGELGEREEEVGAGHLLRERRSEEPRHPDERHPVHEGEAGALVPFPEPRVALGEHDVVHVGREHGSAPAGLDERLDAVERPREGHHVDGDFPDEEPLASGG